MAGRLVPSPPSLGMPICISNRRLGRPKDRRWAVLGLAGVLRTCPSCLRRRDPAAGPAQETVPGVDLPWRAAGHLRRPQRIARLLDLGHHFLACLAPAAAIIDTQAPASIVSLLEIRPLGRSLSITLPE